LYYTYSSYNFNDYFDGFRTKKDFYRKEKKEESMRNLVLLISALTSINALAPTTSALEKPVQQGEIQKVVTREATGYHYGNTSISYSNKTRTFVKNVTKPATIGGHYITTPFGDVLVWGGTASANRNYKEYKVTATVTTRWTKYSNLDNSNLGTVTDTRNATWYEYVAL
jgi:hypothetical protein